MIDNHKQGNHLGSYQAKSHENNMSNPGTDSLNNEVSNNLSDDLGVESSEGTWQTQDKGFKESGSDKYG